MEDREAICYLPMAVLNRMVKKARGNTPRLLLTRTHPSEHHLYLRRSPIAVAEAAGLREVDQVVRVVLVAEGPAAPVEVAQAALVGPVGLVEAAEAEVPAGQVDRAEEAKAARVAVVPREAAEAHWPFWIERWAARVPAERAGLP